MPWKGLPGSLVTSMEQKCEDCGIRWGSHYGDECPREREEKERKIKSALVTQEGGNHYKKLGKYQPWEVLKRWLTPEELRGAAKATAVAYLAREQQKGQRLDIKKAMHTLQIYLELTQEEER